jgi:tetrahydromethanopterin S-methyltransferase subunit G
MGIDEDDFYEAIESFSGASKRLEKIAAKFARIFGKYLGKYHAVLFVNVPELLTVLVAVKVPVLSKVEVSLFSKSTAVKDPSFVKVS